MPRDAGHVSIYACGLTPQAPAHIGHMRGAVLFDVIRRWFNHLGFEVDFVQNFTDIDDKIIRKSAEEGIEASAVAEKYGRMYIEDLERLRVTPARWVYVTKNMDSIIQMIEKIIENGNAYVVDGDVYFRVHSMPDYGKLSNRKLEDMQAGARIEIDERKENPMDFALWKSAKPGEPSWESPWGEGRPGWHIECSALSLKELGANFDIHAGGTDLRFPHHENEIAQSEAYLGKAEFARIWMHWGAVQLSGDKMSKSVGNVLSVREAIEKYSAGAVRLFLLGASYRSPVEYSDSRMIEAQQAYQRISGALRRAKQSIGEPTSEGLVDEMVAKFSEGMNDDFNTQSAIASLHETVGQLNEQVAKGDMEQRERTLALIRTAEWMTEKLGIPMEQESIGSDQMNRLMELVIGWRKAMREQKQFALADQVRDDLKEIGIQLEDSVEGTTWRQG